MVNGHEVGLRLVGFRTVNINKLYLIRTERKSWQKCAGELRGGGEDGRLISHYQKKNYLLCSIIYKEPVVTMAVFYKITL